MTNRTSPTPRGAARAAAPVPTILPGALTLLALLLAVPAQAVGRAACESVLENGSFENTSSPISDGGFAHYSDVGSETVAGWDLESGSAIEIQRNVNGTAAEGDHWLELAASGPTSVSQTVAVEPGVLYELRFAYSDRPFFGTDNEMRVTWAGVERTFTAPPTATTDWRYGSIVVAAPTDGFGTILFEDRSGGNAAAGMLIDDVTLCRVEVCSEELVLPFYLVDREDPTGTTTLYAVRNLTGAEQTVRVEYVAVDGSVASFEILVLGPYEIRSVNLRDVAGLPGDPDGFARGFVRIVAGGGADGRPVLAGDFFQVDVGNDFATGDELLRSGSVCDHASIRFLDLGAGTRLAVYLAQPRGADETADPPSFTVQVYDEAGEPDGAPQPFWTDSHALELTAADLTALSFGSLAFDFGASSGGVVYAEYSAAGRFSVGVASQCEDEPGCGDDCCGPGDPKATTPPLHYPEGSVVGGIPIDDCEAAISDSLRTLHSFHYRNACQKAHGGELPDRVLGARMVSCEVAPPGFSGGVVVRVEACCPRIEPASN